MRTRASFFALLLVSTCVVGCGSDDSSSGGGGGSGNAGGGGTGGTLNPDDFPVNEAFAAELIAKGIPEDVARFFAAQRMEVVDAVPGKYHFRQTFPNGATRDMTYTFGPTENQTPEPEQVTPIGHVASAITDNPVTLQLEYFVPYSQMPPEIVAEISPAGFRGVSQQALSGDGANVIYQETALEGVDVAIGSVIEMYQDHPSVGGLADKLGSIYAVASALSDIAGAADLSKEHNAKMKELELLKNCALHPTNPLAMSDPNYSANAAAAVDAAMTQVKFLTAARFLNQMVDTASGLHPALSLLKPGISWNEQTLKGITNDTEMHEATTAVVACDYPMNATVSFSYTNSYELCDEICHHYDEKVTLNASFQMVSYFPGASGYNGDVGTISMEDLMTFTHKEALNPPYVKSSTLIASGTPTIEATGVSGPTGREVEITAFANVPTVYSVTSQVILNNTSTEQTVPSDVEAYMNVHCKFTNVVFTGGDFTGEVIDQAPWAPTSPGPGTPARSCTLKLVPVPPPN